MILRVDNEETVFNVYRAIQLPRHYEDLAMISVVKINEPAVKASALKEDALEKTLMLFNHLELEEEVEEMLQNLDASCEYIRERSQFEPLDRPIGLPPKPSVEEAKTLELKPLPSHLHYTYLGSSNTLPVIVSSYLSKLQKEKLLRVLREHKHAIGWTMSDKRCEETNIVLNWKKCHFMVREGIVLGNKVSKDGLEVDKAKVEVIEKLPPPISVKGVRSFLGHAGFYRRFIKDFSNISSPLCRLLEKDVPFKFDDACLKAFEELKKKFVSAPIIIARDWKEPFELMCDASDEKELLVVVWVFDKFWAYLEFDLEIRDRKKTENQMADHLSRLETRNHVAGGDVIKETFTDEQLLSITAGEVPWYENVVNNLKSGEMPPDLEPYAKNKFLRDVSDHYAGDKTAAKVLQSSFYWPGVFKDAHEFVRRIISIGGKAIGSGQKRV
ncbi:uncharacterized protein LOC142175775 [Nicotiana tabacum]|uniref:Uncharacterized protein LOC142175775 n=1 Tax=Nicotiana tabacum TaxID=4097 RepID=A0AC58TNR4_TOBAC